MRWKIHVLYTESASLEELRPIFDRLPQPSPKDRIAIKPNLVVPKPHTSGATTDPALVECIVAYLQEKGHSDIRIMESSGVGESTSQAFRVCGYEALSRKYNVPLVDLKKDKSVKQSIGDIDIQICQEVAATDFLINVPVLKAHCQTRLTCALKNLKGCIPDREKRRFHALGLHKPIAALNKAIRTDWIIVDGIIGDLTFEEGGTPINMGRVIAGTDPVLLDTYALHLLGYELHDVPYVSLAAALGAGATDLSKASIIEYLKGDRPPIAPRPANPLAHRYAIYIDEREACSACYGSLIYALRRYEELHGTLPPPTRIAIGQGFNPPKSGALNRVTTSNQAILGVGRCTQAAFQRHVPGCPPTAKSVLAHLVKWL